MDCFLSLEMSPPLAFAVIHFKEKAKDLARFRNFAGFADHLQCSSGYFQAMRLLIVLSWPFRFGCKR